MKYLALVLAAFCTFGCADLKYINQPELKKNATAPSASDLTSSQQLKRDKDASLARESAQEKQKAYDAEHPEVAVAKETVSTGTASGDNLFRAMQSLDFVTRNPESSTPDNVYVNVGTAKLTGRMVQVAIQSYMGYCKKISAYNNTNYKEECMSSLATGLNDFSAMVKDKNIPDSTKNAALGEASYRGYIDFEHAARLAVMHTKLCQQQGNKGYVSMVTIAAPCKGFKGHGVGD
ncbi:MAG: hypothetical protein LKK36_06280 [Ewingella americana]|jgi:hypothetical protein|uniref:hypothetical protein n=1 Tax=Ewingella americana TaxID=41202 RepID=UPI00242DB439|nr:hypothetical protein [Ewingella americana]MCI1676641.1 hypothetical protein [Ewingella americana]MCI1853769.1 hypothetical protein [Ewingella americana]MCI1859990.1 hypothetical protein [Ewingella americana]MCI2142318.1 hypothetical protein [Ewingella americana]MCI2163281.1 hypothetical protein [Ewingella americana]